MQKVERENEVLKKDLKKSQEQVKRLKAAPSKKSKPVKIGAGVAQLTLEKKRLNKYISELLAWGQVSPQYIDTLQHSTQGRLDIIDLKHEDADVSELGETDKHIKSCQRFIVISVNHLALIVPNKMQPSLDATVRRPCATRIGAFVFGVLVMEQESDGFVHAITLIA